MKKTTNKLLALLLTIVMVLGMLPMTAIADNHQENENQQTSGVHLSKTAMPHLGDNDQPDGSIDIRIEAYTTGEVRLVDSTTPTDIILLLDVSGSMNENLSDKTIQYQEAYGTREFRGFFIFGEYYYGMHTNTEYFIKDDENYLPLYGADYDNNNFSLYYYIKDGSKNYVYPKANGNYSASPANDYPLVQFYRLTEVTTTATKDSLMKTAVQRFVQQTALANESVDGAENKHRIAIIKYADDSYYNPNATGYGNKRVKDVNTPVLIPGNNRDNSDYNYTQVVSDFTVVDSSSGNALINATNAIQCGGATSIDYGLTLAEALFNSRTGATGRNTVLVVLTDGEPNHDNNFDVSVAVTAINKASEIKEDTAIYSIGLFTGADDTQLGTNKTNKFMQYISSNYSGVTATGSGNDVSYTSESGIPTGGYYFAQGSDQSLIGIFESIATEIGAPKTSLGEAATVLDVISPVFVLADSENPANSVTIQTADRTYDETNGFGFAEPGEASDVIADVDDDKISVSGFDFDENYLSDEPRNGNFYGRELIITINIKPDYDELDKLPIPDDNCVETNNSLTLLDSEEIVVARTASPKIEMNRVTYQIEGESEPHAEYLRLPGAEVTVIDVPEQQGYDFDGWEETSTSTVTPVQPDQNNQFIMPQRDVVFTGNWQNGDANYDIEYYFQNIENDEYTLDESCSQYDICGATNQAVAADALNADATEGFTLNESKSTMSGTIAADGSTILKVYYDRNVHNVTYQYAEGTPTNAPALPSEQNNVRFGAEVTVADDAQLDGYIFQAWEITSPTGISIENGQFNMPDADVVITGSFAGDDASYTIEYYFEQNDGNYAKNEELLPSDTLTSTTGTMIKITSSDVPTVEGYVFAESNENNVLSGIVLADDSLVLKVYYNLKEHTITIPFTKTVVGTDVPQTNFEFEAEVNSDPTSDVETTDLPTITVSDISANDGAKDYPGTITITGTPEQLTSLKRVGFTVSEVQGNSGEGWTYDTSEYKVEYEYDTTEEASGWVVYMLNDKVWGREEGIHFTNSYEKTFNPFRIPISISKTVALGEDTETAPNETFTFEMFNLDGTIDERKFTITGNTVDTTGATTYTQTMTIIVQSEDAYNLIANGFYLREKADLNAPSEWNYSDAVYHIVPGGTNASWSIYEAVLGVLEGERPFYSHIKNTADDSASFINTYTKNTPIIPPADPDGTAVLVKVDANDNDTYLFGAKFELYRVYSNSSRLVGTYTTDRNGKIRLSLDAGSYYWQEIGAPEGYTLDSTKHEFTIRNYNTTTVMVKNSKTHVPDVFATDHYAYVIGYDDGLVHPEANITRAEVATIFFRLLSDNVRNANLTKTNNFSDVASTAWYNTAVSTMAKMGIINGYPDGTFGPNNSITRAEFAAIAARFDEYGNSTGASFTDIYGHWAMKEISIAANNGWVLGYEDGTFRPDQKITRAEAMTMVNRVLQRIPESKSDLLTGMVTWPDNADTKKWYYLMVQEATNSHYYERKTNGYEYWTEIRPVRDWAALEK